MKYSQCIFASVLLVAAASIGRAAEADNVDHLYVIRRGLQVQNVDTPSVRDAAHSALLVRTKSGKFAVVEFMDDGKAHLTYGDPVELSKNEARRFAVIRMKGVSGGEPREFEWERQLRGSSVPPKYSPETLQRMMTDEMKEYSIWKKEHCHAAQERLRLKLGLTVD